MAGMEPVAEDDTVGAAGAQAHSKGSAALPVPVAL